MSHPNYINCTVNECEICSVRDCPYSDPMHYHHDECPTCWKKIVLSIDGKPLNQYYHDQHHYGVGSKKSTDVAKTKRDLYFQIRY